MKLVEQHIIKKNDIRYGELHTLCGLSKNLYNVGLYNIRQYYFENKQYLNYYKLQQKLQNNADVDYYNLPTKVSQQVLKMVDQNFKSFFGSLKTKKRKIKLPNYLPKDGKFIVIYTNQAISKKELKNGYVKLSGSNIKIKTKHTNIQQVRLIPKVNYIVVEVVYIKDNVPLKNNINRYTSIDLGLNNLATIGSNVIKPYIINGKPLKSINQFYNKELAKIKSELENTTKQKSSNKIKRLTFKRNNKIKDYLHKASRLLVNHLVSNEINTLIIGHNKEWKQDINIGRVNNQKFVNIPHSTFIHMLKYKCELEGIQVIEHEESYTSKCSFLDDEKMCKHEKYMGRRIKRGLFKSADGKLINADVNGALNILKKVVGKFNYDPIEVCSMPTMLLVNS